MDIRAAEISAILKDQIKNFGQEAEVTDAVGDERLLAGGGVGLALEPERHQEVGAGANALPAEEDAQVVGREHQHEHRRDEEVEVAEEPAPPLVVGHVADRVDVDQAADAGDQHDLGPGDLAHRPLLQVRLAERDDKADGQRHEADVEVEGQHRQRQRDGKRRAGQRQRRGAGVAVGAGQRAGDDAWQLLAQQHEHHPVQGELHRVPDHGAAHAGGGERAARELHIAHRDAGRHRPAAHRPAGADDGPGTGHRRIQRPGGLVPVVVDRPSGRWDDRPRRHRSVLGMLASRPARATRAPSGLHSPTSSACQGCRRYSSRPSRGRLARHRPSVEKCRHCPDPLEPDPPVGA